MKYKLAPEMKLNLITDNMKFLGKFRIYLGQVSLVKL